MLDKDFFISKMVLLNEFYTAFKFDIKNTVRLNVWYEPFKDYTKEQFSETVKIFSTISCFPPNSPTHIINTVSDYYKQQAKAKIPLPEEAFEIFRRHNRQFGGLYYNSDKVIKSLEVKYPLIAKTVTVLENDLMNWNTHDNQVPQRFKNYYLALLEKELPVLATSEKELPVLATSERTPQIEVKKMLE